jgi:hypothetical protein
MDARPFIRKTTMNPIAAHRAPDPQPDDDTAPPSPPHAPQPVPQDDPVPDHNPS